MTPRFHHGRRGPVFEDGALHPMFEDHGRLTGCRSLFQGHRQVARAALVDCHRLRCPFYQLLLEDPLDAPRDEAQVLDGLPPSDQWTDGGGKS